MSAAEPRIASLLPSATEIVCALGLADRLVGVSHECDFPPGVERLPRLTRTRVDPSLPSAAIDRDVRRVLADALAVYEVDVDALEAAAPDVVVTQDLCDVCAVSLRDVEAALRSLARTDVTLVNLHPTRLDDVWADLERVGAATGREREAGERVAEARARVARIAERAARERERPATLTIEWLAPAKVGGTWMPELVAAAGGRALVTEPGQHAPTLSREELRALDPAPEVVLVKPCGFPLERTLAEAETLRALLADLPWPALAAGRVWIADGNAFFNRPGPRLVESLEILAACVHPAACADLAQRHAQSYVRWQG